MLWVRREESTWSLQFLASLQVDQILEKYKDRLLCLPIRDVICSCSVPRGLFLVKFLLTAFREFHLGIPTRDRVCGWGMALPLLSQESLVRRHKSSAAWPMGGTWAGRGSLYLHLRTWQERPSGARAGQVKCKELSKGEKAEGIHPSISQKPSASGDWDAWNPGSLDSVALALSVQSLSLKNKWQSLCDLWMPEGWDGPWAWGYGWDPSLCRDWRSAVARSSGHWILSVFLPQHPSRHLPHSSLFFLPHLTSHSFFLDLLLSSICSCSVYGWMVRLFQNMF